MLGKVRNPRPARRVLTGWVTAVAAVGFAGVSAHGSGAAVTPAPGTEVLSPAQFLEADAPTPPASGPARRLELNLGPMAYVSTSSR